MVLKVLSSFLTIGGPMLQFGLKLIPLLYEYKLIKTETQLREIERRFKEAIRKAELSSKDPVSAHDQYDRAKDTVNDSWKKTFGGGDGPT